MLGFFRDVASPIRERRFGMAVLLLAGVKTATDVLSSWDLAMSLPTIFASPLFTAFLFVLAILLLADSNRRSIAAAKQPIYIYDPSGRTISLPNFEWTWVRSALWTFLLPFIAVIGLALMVHFIRARLSVDRVDVAKMPGPDSVPYIRVNLYLRNSGRVASKGFVLYEAFLASDLDTEEPSTPEVDRIFAILNARKDTPPASRSFEIQPEETTITTVFFNNPDEVNRVILGKARLGMYFVIKYFDIFGSVTTESCNSLVPHSYPIICGSHNTAKATINLR